MPDILFLPDAEIRRCAISASAVTEAVETVLLEKAAGRAVTARGMAFKGAAPPAFHAKGGLSGNLAVLKWYGYRPENEADGLPAYWPLILLNDRQTGMPVAVMDGRWLSGLRTAAISAVAARRLADPGSRVLAFVACGAQARSHFEVLRSIFPVDTVFAVSRRRDTAERFAADMREQGCHAAADDAEQAIARADIVVTSVPVRNRDGMLDARWLKPGAFVSMVDLGWSWRRETLAALDLMVTDDLDQGGGASGFNCDRSIEIDLPALLRGNCPGWRPGNRTALIFSGTGLADAAVAALVLEQAREQGLGRLLRL
jgi:ornithine cyclodeaminase/alanine dehydrogenase